MVKIQLESEKCKYLLDPEGGSFRELHVPDQSSDESTAILNHLRNQYSDFHFPAFPEKEVPSSLLDILRMSETDRVLYFEFKGIGFYCYINKDSQIELSFDVREICTQQKINSLIKVIEGISNSVCKDVFVTPENLESSIEAVFNITERNFEINFNS
jgi:hypothetical protein